MEIRCFEAVTASSPCKAITPNPSTLLAEMLSLKILDTVEGCVIEVTSTETSATAFFAARPLGPVVLGDLRVFRRSLQPRFFAPSSDGVPYGRGVAAVDRQSLSTVKAPRKSKDSFTLQFQQSWQNRLEPYQQLCLATAHQGCPSGWQGCSRAAGKSPSRGFLLSHQHRRADRERMNEAKLLQLHHETVRSDGTSGSKRNSDRTPRKKPILYYQHGQPWDWGAEISRLGIFIQTQPQVT